MDSLLQDFRYALRSLKRNRGFAAVAVLTLSLGIGANAMAFGLIEAALLRAPAVRSPETLAAVYTTCRAGDPRCSSSYPDYLDYRERTPAFDDLAGYSPESVTLGDERGAELVSLELVTGNYFDLLGVQSSLGRVVLPSDDQPGGGAVVVLSHDLWRNRFGGDRSVVGRSIRLNDAQFTVVGVAAAAFRGLRLGASPDLWVPLHALPALHSNPTDLEIFASRGTRWIEGLVARLANGASLELARTELLAVSRQLTQEDPAARGPRTVTVDPLPSYVLPGGGEAVIASFLWVLQGVVGLTLLLACVNLANLLLARASSRRRELAVRTAIGAGRGRLVRQLLTESLLLSVLGAGAGLALAALFLSLAARFELPFGFAVAELEAGVNARVALFTGALAVATVAVFGTLPALRGTRDDVVGALREASSTGGPRFGQVLRGLVGVQVALCVVLLAAAGLFLRSLYDQLGTDLGFRPDGVAVMALEPAMSGYGGSEIAILAGELVSRVAALPGVEAASVGTRVPVLPSGSGAFVDVQGYTPTPDEEMRVEFNHVAPGYFRTLGLQILRGREFTPSDAPGGQRVMVINEEMARSWWPGRDPIGGIVHFNEEPHIVVGVARNAAWRSLQTEGTAYVYTALAQNELPGARLNVIARTSAENAVSLLPLLREALREVNPRIAVTELTTMRSGVSRVLAPQRAGAVLLSGFAALALLLASVGIYGVVSYGMAQRRREIGIRVALGAPISAIVSLVTRGMGAPVLLGSLAGLALAAALGRTLRALVIGTSPNDPWSLGGTLIILTVAAAAATLIPARRAVRIDPLEVLRAE